MVQKNNENRQQAVSWDVIVIGGGPAGCTAAAAAARGGAKTLLIESTGSLGGSGTTALVPAWCPFSDKKQIIYCGLASTVFDRARAEMLHVPSEWVNWTPIDSERLKVVYDDLVTGSGATVLFQTSLVSASASDGQVSEIMVANKSGLTKLSASIYIDCSGDADLAAWAGAPFHKGNTSGDLMPATHCFVLCNVNDDAFRDIYGNGTVLERSNPASPIHTIVRSEKYPLVTSPHICCSPIGPSTVGFNAGHIYGMDNTNPWSVSDALMLGRKMARQYRDALAEFCPEAFAEAFLVSTAPAVGARESRRIVGDYTLTLDDYVARRKFNDEISRNCYFLDIHQSESESQKRLSQQDIRYSPGESHGIPYRCLTPSTLTNVLVAGRSISCERAVQGSVRVMPVCLTMGEAAGVAAVMALSAANDIHRIDTNDLRSKLREYGAYLPAPNK